jgi:hypothetical protein
MIVQREIASIREIEEALARQVLYGGDFVTNLFEVSRIEETRLMPVVAESFGLPPAPVGELPKIPEEAVRLVAAEVVSERSFAPLEMGKKLVVAVATPLTREAEQELTFALALPIEQRIAPLFRIRQALARDYGVPLDKRTARLITKVIHNGPRIASTFPPPLESRPNFPLPARPPSMPPAPPGMAGVAGAVAGQGGSASSTPQVTIKGVAATGTLVRTMEAPPARPAKRRRGPLTLDVAKGELESSAERDIILDVLFEFSRQFFDYTALFTVHGDLAEGRDAFGDGASREKVARIGVPLDLPNVLTTARAAKKLLRASPSREGIDPVLMGDLGREGKTECVVLPVVVRGRVVCMVLGDGGISGIDDVGVRQVEGLIEAASGAFERVIMRRKLKQEPPAAEKGVAVAMRKAESVAPPPTQLSAPAVVSSPHPSSHASQRPAAEELAPPIRELLAEPVSRVAATRREPTPDALLPADSAARGDQPPPKHLASIRRPSGAPIPREEPDVPGGASAQRPAGSTSAAPPRTKSGSLKRAEAPPLEFGVPQGPSVVAEKTGAPSDVPTTTRDAAPQGQANWARDPSSPPQVHPWGQLNGDDALSVAPYSPKAVSPPPMPAAPITDMSPQPIGPINAAPPTQATPGLFPFDDRSPTDRSPPSLDMVQPQVAGNVVKRVTPREQRFGTGTLMEGMVPALPPPVAQASPIAPIVVVTPDREMTPVALEGATPAVPPTAPAVGGPPPIPSVPFSESSLSSATSSGQRRGPPSPPAGEMKPMPPSEQQVSVPAHKPPSSRSDHTRILPSVIVDTSTEYVALVDRVLKGPDEEAETDLLRAGGYAMPAIMAKFPGPITIEAERLTTAPLPRVADCGPIIRLVASQRRTALPFVLSHVENPDLERRFWATYLLTELVYPDAVDAAVARVFDSDAKIRLAARTAVRALAEAHPQPVVERVGVVATTEKEPTQKRVQAIETLGEAREPSAVALLLPLVESAPAEIAGAARTALVTITRQDFALDGQRWTEWWEANKHRHRLEWLIDALMHEQRAIRGLASDELRTITKEYFAYYDDLPKRERERAQARYREWWENIGRVRFSRAATRGA